MRCEECTNKTYCEPHKRVPDLRGCGSGIPEFLPTAIAELVTRKVNKAVNAMGFDKTKYSQEVIEEIKKTLAIE